MYVSSISVCATGGFGIWVLYCGLLSDCLEADGRVLSYPVCKVQF